MSCHHLSFAISNDCFMRCRGCYNFFNPQHIANDYFLNFLALVDKRRINKITLSGGDPLTRPDIMDILADIHKMGFRINLDTVGTNIIDDCESVTGAHVKKINIDELKKSVSLVGIPLDGASDASIKTFRTGMGGGTNLLATQMRILATLDAHNIPTCINTVVHKQNMHDLSDIVDIIAKFKNITQWQLFQYMPIGPRGFENRDLFEITDAQFNHAISEIRRTADNCIPNTEITPKTCDSRKNLYIIIDNAGNAWTPNFESNGAHRTIIGNIANPSDIDKILEFLYADTNH